MNQRQQRMNRWDCRFVGWLWEKLTDEDPACVSRNLTTLDRLNGCHCHFVEQLEARAAATKNAELKTMIDQHQKDRFDACC